MIETHGKLLISAFIALIIGIVLLQVVADDISERTTTSIAIVNETLTMASVTGTITNETVLILNGTPAGTNTTGSLANMQILAVSAIRNFTSENLLGFCDVTLVSGALACNDTGQWIPTTSASNGTIYVDYTYTGSRTTTLAGGSDDVTSLDALRNVTSRGILGFCNATLSTRVLVCNNTMNNTGYADYTYAPDNTLETAASRTVLILTILFFALAILAIVIGMAINSFKQGGIF